MTAAALLTEHSSPVSCRDRVRVPDGRIGEVIGFYRRTDELALVRFPCGRSDRFLATEVEPLKGSAGSHD